MVGLGKGVMDLFDYADYVCSKCFNTPDKCTCEFQPYYLVNIDRNIQNVIRVLNEKGYMTRYCCESHNENDSIYIMFARDYGFDTLPDGFIRNASNVIRHEYERRMDYDEFLEDKQRHLKALLDWCEGLSSVR